MKNFIFFGILGALLTSNTSFAATDWSQPPLLCVEDIVPAVPKVACPDLTTVENPSKDDPILPEAELKWWKDQKFSLGYCRSMEIIRREKLAPGSMTPGAVQISYLRTRAVQDHDAKVAAVYNAAEQYGVPPHILTGALMQESIFANLGVSDDGGNFSCGIGQINLPEWCSWAEAQTPEQKRQMGWPVGGVNCSTQASRDLVQPFFEIGISRLNGLPQYRLEPTHTQNIPFESVQSKWADVPYTERLIRYQTASSFLNNCGIPARAMQAKAFVLRRNYNAYIPKGLREHETYAPGQKFGLKCMRPLNSTVYPVQTAWVMTVGTYNAGGRLKDMMASTQKWDLAAVTDRNTFATFNPDYREVPGFTVQDLVASVFKVGKYDPAVAKMRFTAINGTDLIMPWFKLCVVQRHMARIVQHVSRGDLPAPLVTSMEGAKGCAKDSGDPDPR